MSKKFKTLSGYQRSMSNDLYYAQEKARQQGKPVISVEEGQWQMGLGAIGQDEKPLDAVARLREGASEKHLKDLDAVLRWLRQPQVRPTFIGAGAAAAEITHVVTYRGKQYSEAEFTRIDQTAREQNISLDDACMMAAKGDA